MRRARMKTCAASITLAVCGLATGAGASPAEAPAAEGGDSQVNQRVAATYRDEQGVVHYAFEPERLPGARRVTQQGQAAEAGACTFTDEGSGQADGTGPKVRVMRELTFDASRCVRELAVAEYPLAELPSAISSQLETPPTEERSATEGNGQPGSRGPTYIGSLKVNVEDPPQLDVTSTTARVEWSGTASCVTSSHHNAYWGWYSPTGWRRIRASWNYGLGCSRAYTDTYGRYKNTKFCATVDTHSEHSKTWFEGRPNGGWAWAYNVHKWGGCSGLLHYEYILTTP